MAIAKALLDDEDDEVFDLELLIGEAPRWIDNIMGIVLNAQKALMTRNLNTMNRLEADIKKLEDCTSLIILGIHITDLKLALTDKNLSPDEKIKKLKAIPRLSKQLIRHQELIGGKKDKSDIEERRDKLAQWKAVLQGQRLASEKGKFHICALISLYVLKQNV
jgi:hypothetical protein